VSSRLTEKKTIPLAETKIMNTTEKPSLKLPIIIFVLSWVFTGALLYYTYLTSNKNELNSLPSGDIKKAISTNQSPHVN